MSLVLSYTFFHLYHRRKHDNGTNDKSFKAEKRGMQIPSKDSCQSNVRNPDETYLDLDASSRQPQPVYQAMKDSGGNTTSEVRSHSGDMTSSPSRDYEYQDVSETGDPADDDKMYLHLDISSRQPESTYQGITSPVDLINSEMYTELDSTSRSKETEYQDITGNSHDSDQDCEYQVVLNDTFDNANDNTSRQVPIPPPVKRDEEIQDSCGTYVNVKDQRI